MSRSLSSRKRALLVLALGGKSPLPKEVLLMERWQVCLTVPGLASTTLTVSVGLALKARGLMLPSRPLSRKLRVEELKALGVAESSRPSMLKVRMAVSVVVTAEAPCPVV